MGCPVMARIRYWTRTGRTFSGTGLLPNNPGGVQHLIYSSAIATGSTLLRAFVDIQGSITYDVAATGVSDGAYGRTYYPVFGGAYDETTTQWPNLTTIEDGQMTLTGTLQRSFTAGGSTSAAIQTVMFENTTPLESKGQRKFAPTVTPQFRVSLDMGSIDGLGSVLGDELLEWGVVAFLRVLWEEP